MTPPKGYPTIARAVIRHQTDRQPDLLHRLPHHRVQADIRELPEAATVQRAAPAAWLPKPRPASIERLRHDGYRHRNMMLRHPPHPKPAAASFLFERRENINFLNYQLSNIGFRRPLHYDERSPCSAGIPVGRIGIEGQKTHVGVANGWWRAAVAVAESCRRRMAD